MADARGTLDIDALAARPIAASGQLLPAILLLAAFAPALALFPFHGWSPRAYAAAGPGVAMLVPGLLATAAGYGTLRICVGMFPQGMAAAAPVLVGLATVGALYGALLASRQDDMRRGLAFLAMSQQSLVALAIFAATPNSIRGAILLMIASAISMSAALVAVDALARRASSPLLSRSGGIESSAPRLAALATLASFAAIGVPGTAGFAASLLALAGIYERYPAATVVATVVLVLCAAWAATLGRRALHGPPLVRAARDVHARELAVIVPLLIVVLVLGVAPRLVLDRIGEGSVPAVMAAP
jgi:NADH-quinone oxidoreductase subunit M